MRKMSSDSATGWHCAL